jgi:hypothetical protein
VTPDISGGQIWQATDGHRQLFSRRQILAGVGPSSVHHVSIERLSESDYEVRSPAGITWRYSHGKLALISDPRLGLFRVNALGGHIVDVTSDFGQHHESVLHVTYDDFGHPLEISVPNLPPVALEWHGNQLLSVSAGSKLQMAFDYQDRLLAGISSEDGKRISIRWASNPRFFRGDSVWYYPVHLASFDDWNYDYSVSSAGFRIIASNTEMHIHDVTFWNPVQNEIRQIDSNGRRFSYHY